MTKLGDLTVRHWRNYPLWRYCEKSPHFNHNLEKKAVWRIRDVYPGSWFLPIPDPRSRILDPKTATKERGWKKFSVITFYVATNLTKLQIILVLKCWRQKFRANFQRIIELFTQKIVNKLSKIWVWDPGFEIRDPEKTYSGSRGQKGTGSRIRNTGKKWGRRHSFDVTTSLCAYWIYGHLKYGLFRCFQ